MPQVTLLLIPLRKESKYKVEGENVTYFVVFSKCEYFPFNETHPPHLLCLMRWDKLCTKSPPSSSQGPFRQDVITFFTPVYSLNFKLACKPQIRLLKVG